MYAAAWAYTSPAAVEHRRQEATFSPGAALVGLAGEQPSTPVPAEPDRAGPASRHEADTGRPARTGLAATAGVLAFVAGLVASRRRPDR
jgi:hypothetical protein